jgi:NAD(P)-dependent dehydrogenase (short-subunit alcohol dehydrogenase family)
VSSRARASQPVEGPQLLRRGLLEGTGVVVADAGAAAAPAGARGAVQPLAPAVRAALSELGARVLGLEVTRGGQALEEDELDDAVARALSESPRSHALVVDGGGLFAAAGAGREALGVCLQTTWDVTRAVANAAFIGPEHEGGRIIYLAPVAQGGTHAGAACAGLENLCRTLSIEWARHGITTVTIAPGLATSSEEVATLVAYLCSPAGAYFSGCLLDLRDGGAAHG